MTSHCEISNAIVSDVVVFNVGSVVRLDVVDFEIVTFVVLHAVEFDAGNVVVLNVVDFDFGIAVIFETKFTASGVSGAAVASGGAVTGSNVVSCTDCVLVVMCRVEGDAVPSKGVAPKVGEIADVAQLCCIDADCKASGLICSYIAGFLSKKGELSRSAAMLSLAQSRVAGHPLLTLGLSQVAAEWE